MPGDDGASALWQLHTLVPSAIELALFFRENLTDDFDKDPSRDPHPLHEVQRLSERVLQALVLPF